MISLLFTGHRDVSDGHNELIVEYVKREIAGAGHFFVGGARGSDNIALSTVCDMIDAGELPKEFPISIVVPATASQQPAESRGVIGRAVQLGAKVVELGLPYTKLALKERNRQMVDLAWEAGQCQLLAYWRGIYQSGTYSCIRYYMGSSGPTGAQKTVKYVKIQ